MLIWFCFGKVLTRFQEMPFENGSGITFAFIGKQK